MKMKYLIILFVALIAQSCSNEKIENDWTRDNLQGKVLSLSEFSYEAKDRFGNIEKGKFKRYDWENDFYLDSDFQIKYDEKGNKDVLNIYSHIDRQVIAKYVYQYDENGNMTEMNIRSKYGSLKNKFFYKYDENGNMTEENRYDSDGIKYGKDTYKYDEKGNKIEENMYNSDGSLRSKNTYKYEFDKQGNWIKKIEFKDGIPEYILERQYEYYD